MEVVLPISLLNQIPKLIKINDESYILSKNENNEPVLFSASCPHQNNIVSDLQPTIWLCPSHDWKFDSKTGQSINAPQKCLTQFPIQIKNTYLTIDLPDEKTAKISTLSKEKIPPKITVVGSASLLIEWNEFRLLTDPWIEGSAVFDSWINYPPSDIEVKNLPKINAIWISHEHTDHFNEYTLSLLDKSIPVYVPDFDNNRMEKLVRSYGFQNVTSMPHGQLFHISDNINAVSFASGSFWNDNILYLQFGGFSILNVNDAGFNWSIPKIVDKVDLVCSQFSPASGYPATWSHIDNAKKLSLMKDRNLGILKMMKQIVDFCKADYILPFANFNELYQPEHRKYVEMQPKNRLNDVVEFFKDHSVQVIDLLPGESWDGKTNVFTRKSNRENFYKKEFLYHYLDEKHELEKINKENQSYVLSFIEIQNYFERFSDSQITQEIGTYSICFILNHTYREYFLIEFKNGKVHCAQKNNPFVADMTMECPGNIVQDIIRHDLSWDEISSGYWSIFSRNPDTYNVALWRLFHAPWKARKVSLPDYCLDPKTASIADILEKYGRPALDIFEKNGLFCAGCEASMGEKILDGCKFHGLSSEQTELLISELNQLIKNKNLN